MHDGPAAGTHCPWATPPVYCSTCGNHATIEKCRMLSRREGTWRCSQRRVKITQLYRGFGSWPTAELNALSDKEKQEFFKKTSAANGLEVVNQARKILLRTEEKEDYVDDMGRVLAAQCVGLPGLRWNRHRCQHPCHGQEDTSCVGFGVPCGNLAHRQQRCEGHEGKRSDLQPPPPSQRRESLDLRRRQPQPSQ